MSRAELLSLLRTARANPDDRDALRVVADWLEEHGEESDRARAEALRLAGTDEERFQRFADAHRSAWLGPLEGLTDEVTIGPLVALHLTGKKLLSRRAAEALASEAAAWVGELHVHVEPANGPAVAACPLLGHAGRLRLKGRPEALAAVFASPHLARVRHLDLHATRLSDDAVAGLAAAPHLRRVRVLDLSDNPFGGAGLAALAGSAALPALVDLDLSYTRVGDGVAALAAGRLARRLEHLDLSDARVRADGGRALAAGKFPRLRSLELTCNPFLRAGVVALAGSPLVGLSAELDLCACGVTDAGAIALAASPHASGLESLSLMDNRIGDAGAAALAAGPWRGLRSLDLFGNPVGDAGVVAIAASPVLAGLRRLALHSDRVTAVGARALAESPYLRHLESLFVKASGPVAALRERFGEALR